MPVLKRLPNGFKPRVDMVKKYCLNQISALSACRTVKDFCDYLAFSMGCDNIGVYTGRDKKGEFTHIDFDMHRPTESGIDVGAYYKVYKDHVELGETCTVFTCTFDNTGNEKYVDNYKW